MHEQHLTDGIRARGIVPFLALMIVVLPCGAVVILTPRQFRASPQARAVMKGAGRERPQQKASSYG